MSTRCKTKFCRRLAFESGRSPFCPRCRSRRFRERHPVSYFFNKLKQRAKERGQAFTLTRDQFAELWRQKGLNGGKTKFSLSFDRIKNDRGYEWGNVQLLTLSENTRKRFVPYFSSKADEESAVAKTSANIKQLMEAGEL